MIPVPGDSTAAKPTENATRSIRYELARPTMPILMRRTGRFTFMILAAWMCIAAARADDLEDNRRSLRSWLASSDLAEEFDFAKLRRVRRPDGFETGAQWLQWELRFKAEGTRFEEEDERFMSLVRDHRGALGRSLVERLFYRLLQETAQRRADVAVYVFVLERTYSITFDPESRELVLQLDPDRMLRRSIDLGAVDTVGGQVGGTAELAGAQQQLTEHVRSFLTDYFSAPPPARVTPSLPEPDFAGVRVEGIRSRVLAEESYWEKLHVSVDLKNSQGSTRAVCHVSGEYGAGFGNRLPADYYDMEVEFREELERFTEGMLAAMQQYVGSRSPR